MEWEEASDLLEAKILVKAPSFSMSVNGGYACHDILTKSFLVTPEDFLPEQLCKCAPGWAGLGANCSRCPSNTFSNDYNGTCRSCPEGSGAEVGAASCRCSFGKLMEGACGCEVGYGSDNLSCLPCENRNLECRKPGTELSSARPKLGFSRLKVNDTSAVPCLPPREARCNSSVTPCGDGYRGILCSDCADGYFASHNRCKPCGDGELPLWPVAAFVVSLAVISVVGCVWYCRRNHQAIEETGFSARQALKDQLKEQGPILLQMCQLWAVLALLAKDESVSATQSSFWEVPYVEAEKHMEQVIDHSKAS